MLIKSLIRRLSINNMADKAKRPRLHSMKEKSYFESYCDISVHEEMLGDGERTNAYKKAIFSCRDAISGKVVLDVGAGTGILSCFCAQVGAAKVYAVEASKIAKQAEKVVEHNGLQDRVQVIHGVMEEVNLPEKVDIIVSEWMGYCLLYESMLSSVIWARDKWLKPGGLMLPDHATIFVAPVCDDEVMVEKVNFWNDMDEVYGVDMACLIPFARESLAKEVMVKCIGGESVLSHEQTVAKLDLYTVTTDDLSLVQYKFSFKCFGIADLQGFSVWFDVKFSGHDVSTYKLACNGDKKDSQSNNHTKNSVILSTSPFKPETHWKQSILYLDNEVAVQQDSDISGKIQLRPEKYNPRFLSITLDTKIDDGEMICKKYSMGYELPKADVSALES
ncbi:protein arginine N-methyltransferase 6-like [Styela clava]|uniref:protein arginine N-methyltransferase 6-like n=1 Tax=Styela clava TaxID=7725 RepID=UPI001939737B|nr:protein arginine N-methyltransferase 6-like [Styela clava]